MACLEHNTRQIFEPNGKTIRDSKQQNKAKVIHKNMDIYAYNHDNLGI